MTDRLLDTGILIRHLRKSPGYRGLLHSMALEGHLYISAMTRLEIVRGMREHERQITIELLDSMIILPVDDYIADLAGDLIRTWGSQGVSLGYSDAVNAALAHTFEIDLITTNPQSYPMPELNLWQVDSDGQMTRWA
jgi:predicted nucleic acid-binding protein